MSRICIVRHYYYPEDPRGRREAEALAAAGHDVEVLALRKAGEAPHDEVNGVRVRRLPVEHRRGSVARYCFEYGAFFVLACLTLTWRHLRRRYAVVQVNTMPDLLVFVAALPKLLGARIVLDMHESMPELFLTKYQVAASHPMVRLLGLAEQASIRIADQAIVCTPQQRDTYVARGARAEKITIVLNSANTALFRPRDTGPAPWRPGAPFRLITHGLIEQRYGHDTMVRAVALLREEIPGLTLQIYGRGQYLPDLTALIHELGVADRVQLKGFVPHEELLAGITRAHVGLVATRRDPFWELAHTQKMFEYVAMRRPVIIGETRAVRDYFDDACFGFFVADDPADLARRILTLYHHPERAQWMVASASRRYREYCWEHQQHCYCHAVLGDAVAAPDSVSVAGEHRGTDVLLGRGMSSGPTLTDSVAPLFATERPVMQTMSEETGTK
jgi:glycosyltransferase involved in cell wall biosynthesis